MRYLAVCLLTAFVFADAGKTIKMADFDGKDVQEAKVKVLKGDLAVKKGETFSVRLESNPSTGYSWQVLGPDYGPLELKKTHFEKSATGKIGAPGVQVFEFMARKENQQVVLIFNYNRSFEGLGSHCYQLRVKVGD